jgi:L-rhamnose isomerase
MLPAQAVWNYYCLQQQTPPAMGWLKEVRRYEDEVLSKRG